MGDRIRLEGLEVEAVVGVYAHERLAPQRLIIDVSVETNTRSAGKSDALNDTLDYDQIAAICRVVASERHYLIEAVAERIAESVLKGAPPAAKAVQVRVEKRGAVAGARAVAVEIERRRPAAKKG